MLNMEEYVLSTVENKKNVAVSAEEIQRQREYAHLVRSIIDRQFTKFSSCSLQDGKEIVSESSSPRKMLIPPTFLEISGMRFLITGVGCLTEA